MDPLKAITIVFPSILSTTTEANGMALFHRETVDSVDCLGCLAPVATTHGHVSNWAKTRTQKPVISRWKQPHRLKDLCKLWNPGATHWTQWFFPLSSQFVVQSWPLHPQDSSPCLCFHCSHVRRSRVQRINLCHILANHKGLCLGLRDALAESHKELAAKTCIQQL